MGRDARFALHRHDFEQRSRWRSRERRCIFGNGPDHGRQELPERRCGLHGVEVQIDQHILQVTDRPLDSVRTDPCIPPRLPEAIEGSGPGLEVCDRVLDVKGHHASDRTGTCRPGESQEVGVLHNELKYVGRVSVTGQCASHDDARLLRLALLDELRQIVPFDAFAWLLTDPETAVGTSPIADVPCLPELPRLIRLKYATEVNRWTRQSEPVARLHDATDGRLEQSLVWRELLRENGVKDVASIVFRDRFGCWSFLDLWRTGMIFTNADESALRTHVSTITEALRRCVARTFAASRTTRVIRTGPIVLVLSPDLEVRAQTPETEQFLRALVPPDGDRRPVPAAAYNVAAQFLAVEAGVDDHPPVARAHLDGGGWLTLRAARIDDNIAVSIEVSSPTETLDLFRRAAGLTVREAELLDLLAAGADTRAAAQRMFLSEHTIQDHLKSVFAKTGTRSRRELLARATGR
jgi:DNA-binding CsgD family transcriptional regulator